MGFVHRARSSSFAGGFSERDFAAHVLLSAVDQVDLDQYSREAFLAIADELSRYRPLDMVEELSARLRRREASLQARRLRRQQRIADRVE